MAMTLRLDDALDREVQERAQALGISKQQLVVRATRDYLTREAKVTRTIRNAEQVIRANAGLLERLGE